MTYPPHYETDDSDPNWDSARKEKPADDTYDETERDEPRVGRSDPMFGYAIALALSLGLSPLIPDNTDLRFVIVWSVLAIFGVLAWLFGDMERIEQDYPQNIVWGFVFGLIIGVPLLMFATSTLAATSRLLFHASIDGQVRVLSPGVVLALLVFVQPLAETLFFRGVFQMRRPFWMVGLLASLWSFLLFFPLLNIRAFPLVVLVVSIALVLMNLIYSYVRLRNGLAAAWVCQITLNLVLLFIPFIAG